MCVDMCSGMCFRHLLRLSDMIQHNLAMRKVVATYRYTEIEESTELASARLNANMCANMSTHGLIDMQTALCTNDARPYADSTVD